jgi:SAM-dependent methyltransferase
MLGSAPSAAALHAAKLFSQEGVQRVLELGAGTGRDTKLFAVSGFQVTAVDYAPGALAVLTEKMHNLGLADAVHVVQHDVRQPLPFADGSFDACYSHMLFCMALTMQELKYLAEEIRRVLKPGGLCVYTVRHTGDSHYGAGLHRGEDMYELNGYVIQYFDRKKIERLAQGYDLLAVDEFTEGTLPRRLYLVTMRKKV